MAKNLKVYGIKNCDTMKKTFKFLEEKGIVYDFVDYKKEKPSAELLESFLDKVALGDLVNKRGTTFRKLPEEKKVLLDQRDSALTVLVENSSMIKRPVMVYPDGDVLVGFDKEKIETKK